MLPGFRCCYCYQMNQARKMRPFAPRLEFPEVPKRDDGKLFVDLDGL